MKGNLGDSTARLALPAEPGLAPVITGPARSFLRLCHLPRSASDFITRRLARAVQCVGMKGSPRPARVGLLLRSRAGTVRVVLRVFRAGPPDRHLAALARGAPATVQAEYRPLRRGGTLTFISTVKRED